MRGWWLAVGVAAVTGSAAFAAVAPTPEPEEIVVEGERLSPAQARERAVTYIEHTGIATGKESVARWVNRICPRVIGLAPTLAYRVETRLRNVATEVGVPIAKPGCRVNLTVNFVGDGAAFARSVVARDRGQFSEVPPGQRDTLLNGTAPIRWWYMTQTRSRDGGDMNGMDPSYVTGAESGGATLPSNGQASTMQNYNASIVSTQMARTLRSATVVVDTVRAEGATLDAVADYAALVAFAEMAPRDAPLAGSILGLFGKGEAPRTLSKLDMAFLRELYSLPLDRKARQQRGRLVRALQNEQVRF